MFSGEAQKLRKIRKKKTGAGAVTLGREKRRRKETRGERELASATSSPAHHTADNEKKEKVSFKRDERKERKT
ncbi:hypothetical protein U1Q18_036315 [Sarracenia purpurea var. burkii]